MKYIVIILIALSTLSCSDFINEEVFTSATPDKFYKNEKELTSAVNAAYNSFQTADYYDNQIFMVADASTDMLDTPWKNVYDVFSTDAGNDIYKIIWEATWKANNAVNAVIEKGPSAVMDEELKSRLIGEAKFLRALNYFNLVRMYGRVPLVLNFITDVNSDIYPKTVPLDTIYTQIIKDLKDAEVVLPWKYDAANIGRASKGAAKSLLGKVYLTYAGYRLDTLGTSLVKGESKYYQMAVDKLKEVIDSKVYDLYPDYADNFKNSTENGIEDIFDIQYKQGVLGAGGWGGEGSIKQTRWAPNYGITLASYETYTGNKTFYASFGATDLRKSVIFLDHFTDKDNVKQSYPKTLKYPYVKKYIRDIHEGGDKNFSTASPIDGEENTIVLRYADVLLMYSEALMEAQQAITDECLSGINKVRQRAGLNVYTTSGFANLDAFRTAIITEREWELCYEGHGWFDDTRMGLLQKRVAKTSLKFYYWPIPYLEIVKNPNLKQSPGWN